MPAKQIPLAEIPAACDRLQELQVRRKFFIGLINQQSNAAKALARRALGWRWDAEEGARDKLNGRAAKIVALALKGEAQSDDDNGIGAALAEDLTKFAEALGPLEHGRHGVELEMCRIVRSLPINAWRDDEARKGLGEKAVAILIGEAGDPSNYPNPAKLWRRLGLAPFNGKAPSTWRREGGLTADEWSAVGYSPRRRAEIYAAISEPLFKHQTMRSGAYRAAYDRRRARTAETHPDWRPIRSHMDALRIMTKQLVLDLWVEWRRAAPKVETVTSLPAAEISLPPILDVTPGEAVAANEGAPPATLSLDTILPVPAALLSSHPLPAREEKVDG